MRAFLVALAMAASLVGSAYAQDKRVSPQQSKLLLLAPHLEDLQPVYQNFGWTANALTEVSYGGVARANATPGRLQAFFHQLAPITYWSRATDLDGTWVRQSLSWFKDREVRVVAPAPAPGPYQRVGRFETDGASCAIFELRHLTNDVGSTNDVERQSVTGIFCPPTGVVLDDALIQRVLEGIFVRRDGRIERVLKGVDKPIPERIRAADRLQG